MVAADLSIFRRLDFGLRPLLLGATIFVLAACGGGYGGGSGNSSMMAGGTSAPTITAQPMSVSAAMGQTVTFSVTATGATGYQWLRNGMAIAAATGARYTTPMLTAADNGSQFAVRVSNAYGTVTSSPAMLTIM